MTGAAGLRRWRRFVCGGLPLLLWWGGCAGPPPPSLPPGSLPAYAHNDYRNRRPLAEALDLGFSGVEADVHLVDGELLVAHDRSDARPGRTLRALYLEPLSRLVTERGTVRPDGQPFILNLEAKEPDTATFAAVQDLLLEYRSMLVRVEAGREIPAPVQVILVGHHPPLAELAELPIRPFAVQCYFRDLPADHARIPAHLLRLVTARYPEHFQWEGEGPVPAAFRQEMADLASARDAVPGRLLRVFKVPRRPAVYQALRDGGVDLVGTEHLTDSARQWQTNQTMTRAGGD